MVKTFVLSVGGAFNPVHCSHVEILELAKKNLEALFPGSKFIGLLAVSLGSHVRKKCGKDQAIKNEHRLAMTSLVSKETTWLLPTTKCYGNAMNCSDEFLVENIQQPRKDVFAVEVVGGDKAKPTRRSKGNRVTVMITRKGHKEKLSEFRRRPAKKGWNILRTVSTQQHIYRRK